MRESNAATKMEIEAERKVMEQALKKVEEERNNMSEKYTQAKDSTLNVAANLLATALTVGIGYAVGGPIGAAQALMGANGMFNGIRGHDKNPNFGSRML